MDVKIHTKGIAGSAVRKPDEEAGALFGGILEIDGAVYDLVTDIVLKTGEDFATVTATLVPGDVEVVNHDQESWDALMERHDVREKTYKEAKRIRNSMGLTIARVPGEAA